MDADERSRYAQDRSGWKKVDMAEFVDDVPGQIFWRMVGQNMKIALLYAGTEGEAVVVGAASMAIEQQRESFRAKVQELVIQFRRAGVYGIIEPEKHRFLSTQQDQQLRLDARLRRKAKQDADARLRAAEATAANARLQEMSSALIGSPKWYQEQWAKELRVSRKPTEQSE